MSTTNDGEAIRSRESENVRIRDIVSGQLKVFFDGDRQLVFHLAFRTRTHRLFGGSFFNIRVAEMHTCGLGEQDTREQAGMQHQDSLRTRTKRQSGIPPMKRKTPGHTY